MQIQQIPAVVDWVIHSGETCVIVGAVIAFIRKQGRDESVRKNYPPHRHSGDQILYPSEYPPPKSEELQ